MGNCSTGSAKPAATVTAFAVDEGDARAPLLIVNAIPVDDATAKASASLPRLESAEWVTASPVVPTVAASHAPAPMPARDSAHSTALETGVDIDQRATAAARAEARAYEESERAAQRGWAADAAAAEVEEREAYRRASAEARALDRAEARCETAVHIPRMYPRELRVACPAGVGAGAVVVAVAPDGRRSHVCVPANVAPGGVFMVPIEPTEEQAAHEAAARARDEEDGAKPAASPRDGGYQIAEYTTQGSYKIAEYKSEYD